MNPNNESQTEEQEVEVRHLQQQNINREDGGYHINATQSLRAFGISEDEFGDYSFQYQPLAFDEIGMVPAFVIPSDEVPDGRTDDNIRSVVRSSNPKGVSSRCRVPTGVLETLGYDPDDTEGEKVVDLWVGDEVVFLSHVESREFEIELPDGVDRVTPEQLEG